MARVVRWAATACTVALASAASAISFNSSGTGQYLIVPYYTVRASPVSGNPYNVLLSVINGAPQGKVVKVRFREALAGAVVFEANLFLSAMDVWTAAVVPTSDGAGIFSRDASCTIPQLSPGVDGAPTVNGLFQSSTYASDPLGPAQGRVREGFAEFIELGSVKRGSTLERTISHVSGVAQCNVGSESAIQADLEPPTGRLFGNVTLINVLEGTAYSYDAAALADWSRVALYSSPGTGAPTLADTNPRTSTVLADGRIYITGWNSGTDAASAVLMAGTTSQDFMRETSVAGATDIVYTMPTKPLLVNATTALPPFALPLTSDGACEPTLDYTLSREEQLNNPNESGFPEVSPHGAMCWASTIQSFNAIWPHPAAVTGSAAGIRHFAFDNVERFPEPTIYQAGVANQNFLGKTLARQLRAPGSTIITDTTTGSQSAVQGATYSGLPVLGISLVRYVNGSVPVAGQATLSNYGAGGSVRVFPNITLP